MMNKTTKGFSLVELAIVLVIIGLITGGILTGQDLIRASELNSVMTDVNKYKTAVNTFKLKYNGVPGDIANATAYWGTASGGCPSGTGTGTQTCNGDNDGVIEWAGESIRAWQHLANAGLVPGSYTGSYTANTAIIGTNIAASKISSAGFTFTSNADAFAYVNTIKNRLHFGSLTGTTDIYTYGNALTTSEANSIDTKYDDGLPVVGLIRSGHAPGCSSSTAVSATYVLSNTAVACSMSFDL